MRKSLLSLFSFILVLSFLFGGVVLASDSGGVVLTPIQHELQNKDVQSWFDLDTSKHRGKTIKLGINLRNTSSSERVIMLEKTNIISVQNGGLDFVEETETAYTGVLDDKVAIKDNVSGLPKEVSFKPNEEKDIYFDVKVPDDKGQFLVGITYIHKDTEEEKVESTEGGSIQVRQQLRFATPIMLTNTVEPKKELDVKGVSVELDRGSPRILINLENNNGMLESSSLKYKINSKESGKTIFEGETNGFLMAPYTYIRYPVTWSGDLASGDYEVEVTVKHKFENDEYKEKSSKIDFDIKEKEIEKVVADSEDTKVIYKQKTPAWVWYGFGGFGVVLLGVIVFMLFKFRKNKESDS